ncbi:hypothetical protein Tco_1028697 [Tanacetum coccineum]|uniref:Uncharacterized protein n=1 Tax=Tanacetum coccineum TaxID=301880 RepID=A0ABQ5G1D5_9ASTR
MLSFLKRYSGIIFTHDPKPAKVSKGFEAPNLQGRVNSPGSSIIVETSPWTNVDPFFPSSKLSTSLSGMACPHWKHVLTALIEVEGKMSIGGSSVVRKKRLDKLKLAGVNV